MVVNSVEITADGQAKTGAGRLRAVVLTAAAADATLILYDNTAASGTKIITLAAKAGTSAIGPAGVEMVFGTGCYADIGGSGAAAYLCF